MKLIYSLAAVAAIGWTSFSQLQGLGGAGAQLAVAPERAAVQTAPVVAVAAEVNGCIATVL